MARLREPDFRRVLAFLREADDVDGSEPFPVHVLEGLAQLIPADVANFCELDYGARRILSDTNSDGERYEFDHDEDLSEAWYMLERLPACVARHRTGRPDALMNSDFMTTRELRASELWELRFRPFGMLDELSTVISRSRRFTKTFLFHAGREFDERDRLVLDLLRPHLRALYRRAAERRRADAAIAAFDAVARGTQGVIVVGAGGRIELVTATARRLAAAYLDEPPIGHLTEPLASWLRQHDTRLNRNAQLPPPAEPLRLERDGGRLVVSSPLPNVLLLEEDAASSREALGLTRREWEVLEAVASGKKNAEVAELLWVSPSTVRKHLEHVYEKLGVHTRTAAIARAFAPLN